MLDNFVKLVPEFVECDLQSSTGYQIIKNYYLATPLHVDADLMKPRKSKKEQDAKT